MLDFAHALAGVQPTLAGLAPTGLVETIDYCTHFAAINNASDPVTIPVQASEVVMGSGLNGNALPLAPMGYALLKR